MSFFELLLLIVLVVSLDYALELRVRNSHSFVSLFVDVVAVITLIAARESVEVFARVGLRAVESFLG